MNLLPVSFVAGVALKKMKFAVETVKVKEGKVKWMEVTGVISLRLPLAQKSKNLHTLIISLSFSREAVAPFPISSCRYQSTIDQNPEVCLLLYCSQHTNPSINIHHTTSTAKKTLAATVAHRSFHRTHLIQKP
ncbi:hypothetical protein L1887_39143 [Cichorium endivia]|nr:hypothetical protein L1887_39143 [Cichorium endivia]